MGLMTEDAGASSTVRVTQSWQLSFTVSPGEDASELAAKLESACRVNSPDCALVVTSRRRALQGGSGSAVLSRSLGASSNPTQSLAAEIAGLESSGVVVTTTSFRGVDVLLSVTKHAVGLGFGVCRSKPMAEP